MKLFVKLTSNSKHTSIKKTGDNNLSVKVKEPPQEGRANKALIEVLSDKLGVSKSRIQITSGHKSKNKVIEIN